MTKTFDVGALDPFALKSAYETDGYFVLKNVFSADEIEALRAETVDICNGKRGDVIGANIVTADTETPEEAMQRVLAIHFPHKVSDIMRSTLTQPTIVEALQAIIGPDVKCMQSMLFLKNAGKPGQAWHQDEYYIPTRDMSLAGIWIALDDARIDNGGLWMHPGSHKEQILWPTHTHGDVRFDSSAEAHGFPYEREGGVSVDADAGDVVIFHGYVLHRSLNNTRKTGYRRAIVNHVMSARSLLPWSMGIPPTPRDDFRDFEMIWVFGAQKWHKDLLFALPGVRVLTTD
ncbi:MAG: phytanoyl-CoA dioxygenase family protein, partial [Pseudomonadota bacterium]